MYIILIPGYKWKSCTSNTQGKLVAICAHKAQTFFNTTFASFVRWPQSKKEEVLVTFMFKESTICKVNIIISHRLNHWMRVFQQRFPHNSSEQCNHICNNNNLHTLYSPFYDRVCRIHCHDVALLDEENRCEWVIMCTSFDGAWKWSTLIIKQCTTSQLANLCKV